MKYLTTTRTHSKQSVKSTQNKILYRLSIHLAEIS